VNQALRTGSESMGMAKIEAPEPLLGDFPAGPGDLPPLEPSSKPGPSSLLEPRSEPAIEQETLALLEWPRLAGHVAGFASTAAGERHCAALPLPSSCRHRIRLKKFSSSSSHYFRLKCPRSTISPL